MDGHQFDQFARVVASGVSRRRVLGMLSGAIASIGTTFIGKNALAGCGMTDDTCQSNEECCDGFLCGKGTCFQECGLFGDSCTTSGLDQAGGPLFGCCASGLECIDSNCDEPQPTCGNEGDACFDPRITNSGDQFSCCNDGRECIEGTCQFPEPVCGDAGDYCGPKSNECCNQGLTCIDDFCAVPEPTCVEDGGTCSDGDDCCQFGQECVDGTCQFPCTPLGENCQFADCCDPEAVCVGDAIGVCTIPEPACSEPGGKCGIDVDCCSGICCGGICADIECCVDDADPNDRCAEGTSCFEGICEGVAEICEADDDCGTGTCCCDDGSCSEDCCDPPVEEDDDEPVTELPNTGAGQDVARSATWIGAAAIGAAAAFLGGKTLKPESDTKSGGSPE